MRAERHLLLAALGLGAAALTHAAPDDSGWMRQQIAACEQQYDAERCADPDFLDQHFHTKTLPIAHKAAARGQREEQRAMRELLLQRLCDQDLKKYCAVQGSEHCEATVAQQCTEIKREAAQCLVNAKQFCADSDQADCMAQTAGRCPSAKKQKIEVLLAKYPKLSERQQSTLRQTAQRIDASTRSLIGSVFEWLGF